MMMCWILVSCQDRVQQRSVEQITVLSCGGAKVQFIIRVVAVPVVGASLASLATNRSSFASVE